MGDDTGLALNSSARLIMPAADQGEHLDAGQIFPSASSVSGGLTRSGGGDTSNH